MRAPAVRSAFPAMPSRFSNWTLKCIRFMPSSGWVRCSLLDQRTFGQRSSLEEVLGLLGPFPRAFTRPSGQIRPSTVAGPVRTGFESPERLFQSLLWSKDFKLLAVYPELLLGRWKPHSVMFWKPRLFIQLDKTQCQNNWSKPKSH